MYFPSEIRACSHGA